VTREAMKGRKSGRALILINIMADPLTVTHALYVKKKQTQNKNEKKLMPSSLPISFLPTFFLWKCRGRDYKTL